MFPKCKYDMGSWKEKRQRGQDQQQRLPCFSDCWVLLLSSTFYSCFNCPAILTWVFSDRCSFWPVLQLLLSQQKKKWIYTKHHCWACPKDVRLCKCSSCDVFLSVETESRKHQLQTSLSAVFRHLILWGCHLYCYFYFYWPQWLCFLLDEGLQQRFSEQVFSFFTRAAHTTLLCSLMPDHVVPVWSGSSMKKLVHPSI